MPIVASQHQWKDKEHIPLDLWPDDCLVQWGGRGIVLSIKPEGHYQTAFFEAFPSGGGFIRGEGPSIVDAEASAFAKFQKISVCAHQWSRKGYINGGGICRCCGAFQSVFQPIVTLGVFRNPLTPTSLELLAEGAYRPCMDDPGQHKYHRRQWLKAKMMGIDVPDFFLAPPAPRGFQDDDYALASRRAVVSFLRANPQALEAASDGCALSGIFEGLHISSLKHMMQDDEGEVFPSPSL